MCITVSRRDKCDGRPCAIASVSKCGRMAKRTLKEFHKVSEVSNTSPKARIKLFLDMASLCFAIAAALSYSSISLQASQFSGYILALCLRFCFQSVS